MIRLWTFAVALALLVGMLLDAGGLAKAPLATRVSVTAVLSFIIVLLSWKFYANH